MDELITDHNKKKSLVLFQIKVKEAIRFIKELNKDVSKIYSLLYSIMINLTKQRSIDVIDQEEYNKRMEEVEKIFQLYQDICKPVTLSIFKKYSMEELILLILKIKEKIKECCIVSAALKCNDILTIFTNSSELKFNQTYQNLIEFYNNFFIPLSTTEIYGKEEVTKFLSNKKIVNLSLPFAQLLITPAIKLVQKIEGASIGFPLSEYRLIIIHGVFKEDPLNISRHGGTFNKKKELIHSDLEFLAVPEDFKQKYIEQLSLRDFLVLTTREITLLVKNSYEELKKYKRKSLSTLVKEFVKSSQEQQRKILTLFLISEDEYKFNASIIFDLIANQSYLFHAQPKAHAIYDSLHYVIKKEFKIAFKQSEEKKIRLKQMTLSDIDYESRIATLKVSDKIKSKAMEKYKEMSGTKESSAKARQYLDNLLKIPFGVYREENIIKFLEIYKEKCDSFINIFTSKIADYSSRISLMKDTNATYVYIKDIIISLMDDYRSKVSTVSELSYDNFLSNADNVYTKLLLFLSAHNINLEETVDISIEELLNNVHDNQEMENVVNNCIKYEEINEQEGEELSYDDEYGLKTESDVHNSDDNIKYSTLTQKEKDDITKEVTNKIADLIKYNKIPSRDFIENCMKKINYYKSIKESLIKIDGLTESNIILLKNKIAEVESSLGITVIPAEVPVKIEDNDKFLSLVKGFTKELIALVQEWKEFKKNKIKHLQYCRATMEKCVHGHKNAKQAIIRQIGQWMNGKNKGACLGLHGPPGVGKTTFCKNGIAQCLVDENGCKRPFAFLALGGATNGSILEGHSYTYLGSTWGKIVDILMETECMNPIIYIDELDKISQTEHGKELVGILTHLTDRTQNMEFEDKYFAGIKLDLSKVLFVFSYNDSSVIDRVLKDRITEIKIKALTKSDKVVVTTNYVLPDIYQTVGFNNSEITVSKSDIGYIIDKYTYEAGVRKLNEILFDIVRDINIKKIMNDDISFPFKVEKEFIKEIMRDKPEVTFKKVAKSPMVGLINGMYATTTGSGGITIIEVMHTPSDKKLSLEKLTGSQGDIMKESMNCALTIAWNMLPITVKKHINEDKNCYGGYGLHIHCPETSTPKDGPSAGVAITIAIISRLCGVAIKNNVAVTGEIDLIGNVHKVGGIEAKITGATRAGATLILLPEDNRQDYERILERQKEDLNLSSSDEYDDIASVEFIKTINDAIGMAFVDNELEFSKII